MGGIGTEYLAAKYPERWAAVAPAGCPTPVWSYPWQRLRNHSVAMLFVHGELDNLAHYQWSAALAAAADRKASSRSFCSCVERVTLPAGKKRCRRYSISF